MMEQPGRLQACDAPRYFTTLHEIPHIGSILAPILGAWQEYGMRIIARRTLREFVAARRGHKDHAALKAALDAWFDEVKKARWSSAADIKRSYAAASIVSAKRIVFNIKGDDYRLVVAIE
jgi:mRNA interferase HigB